MNERINWSVIEEDFKSSFTGRLSRSGWWFRFAETTWRSQWWASYPTMGWYSMAVFIGRDTLQWKPCSFLRPDPFPQKDSKRRGTSIEAVDRTFQSKDPKGRSGLIPRFRKKTSPIPPIPKLPKNHWHLQEHCDSGRIFKTKYESPQLCQASNQKSPQQKKGQEGNPRLQTIGRPGSWTVARCPKNKSVLMQTLLDAWSIAQNKTDKHKIYSLTNPMSVVFPKAKPINLLNSAAKSRSQNPWQWNYSVALALPEIHDGHTVQDALKQIGIIGKQNPHRRPSLQSQRIWNPFADSFIPQKQTLHTISASKRIRFRKRAGLEATISHLKSISMKCYLKGESGSDHVILAAAAYNLRKWINLGWILFLNCFKNPNFTYLSNLGNSILFQTDFVFQHLQIKSIFHYET